MTMFTISFLHADSDDVLHGIDAYLPSAVQPSHGRRHRPVGAQLPEASSRFGGRLSTSKFILILIIIIIIIINYITRVSQIDNHVSIHFAGFIYIRAKEF